MNEAVFLLALLVAACGGEVSSEPLYRAPVECPAADGGGWTCPDFGYEPPCAPFPGQGAPCGTGLLDTTNPATAAHVATQCLDCTTAIAWSCVSGTWSPAANAVCAP